MRERIYSLLQTKGQEIYLVAMILLLVCAPASNDTIERAAILFEWLPGPASLFHMSSQKARFVIWLFGSIVFYPIAYFGLMEAFDRFAGQRYGMAKLFGGMLLFGLGDMVFFSVSWESLGGYGVFQLMVDTMSHSLTGMALIGPFLGAFIAMPLNYLFTILRKMNS